jgi:hypothetical protein
MIMRPLIPVAMNNEDQNHCTHSNISIQDLNYSEEQDLSAPTLANPKPPF